MEAAVGPCAAGIRLDQRRVCRWLIETYLHALQSSLADRYMSKHSESSTWPPHVACWKTARGQWRVLDPEEQARHDALVWTEDGDLLD